MNTRLGYAVAWLIICGAILMALVPLNVPTYLRLVQHGQHATATITQLDCGNHNRASYIFDVGRMHYSSADTMTVNCETLKLGDRFEVYYDTLNPTLSRAEEPIAALINELIVIGLACLLVPTGAIAAIRRWSVYRRKNSS